ncbi:MAG: UDP-N-acetylmuramate dehydrogenase [Candidatus Margulisbacteria bacterium]|nr:UDP-N-acetylmuramate dehydrogenase [Candidatus Margulisiibacteriota bacterium]
MNESTLNASKLSNLWATGLDYRVIYPENIEELLAIKEPYIVIGNGTNSFYLNPQKEAFVSLKLLKKITILPDCQIEAEAGVLLPEIIAKAKKFSLSGLEFTYPVPASLGGAIVQNFGAYDEEISNLLKKITVLNPKTKIISEIKITSKQKIFSYRSSTLKKEGLVLLNATLQFHKDTLDNINKKLSEMTYKRKNLYPLNHTLGSVFLNTKEYSAGKLLDEAGLKGFQYKNTFVSKQHANVIITKNSSVQEVNELIQIMKKKVKEKFKIELKEEIVIR